MPVRRPPRAPSRDRRNLEPGARPGGVWRLGAVLGPRLGAAPTPDLPLGKEYSLRERRGAQGRGRRGRPQSPGCHRGEGGPDRRGGSVAEQPAPAEPVRPPGSAAAAREPALRAVLGTGGGRPAALHPPAPGPRGRRRPFARCAARSLGQPGREKVRGRRRRGGGKRRRGADSWVRAGEMADKLRASLHLLHGRCVLGEGGAAVCVRRSRVGRPEEGSVFPASCTQLPCGAPSLACHSRLWHLSGLQ